MDNQRILQDFLDLVKIDAASGNERGVADAVKAKMAEIGVSLEEDHSGEKIDGNTGNLFGVLDGGLPGSVLLNAHMDRVANGFGIKPVIGDDRIIRSDGTTILAADDLSGVVALIDCARRLKGSGKKFPRVEFLFTIGEETGLFGSKYFDVSKLRSKVGYAFDSPGRMGRVVCAAPGHIKLLIEVEGRAAHAGNCPEDGINATVVLAKILANIRDGRLD
ncbi:MAG: M28 family peptidase, partial [Pyramidobacter sp.]|nr:M28 family peptidase [Pyramidobacter sp.]